MNHDRTKRTLPPKTTDRSTGHKGGTAVEGGKRCDDHVHCSTYLSNFFEMYRAIALWSRKKCKKYIQQPLHRRHGCWLRQGRQGLMQHMGGFKDALFVKGPAQNLHAHRQAALLSKAHRYGNARVPGQV